MSVTRLVKGSRHQRHPTQNAPASVKHVYANPDRWALRVRWLHMSLEYKYPDHLARRGSYQGGGLEAPHDAPYITPSVWLVWLASPVLLRGLAAIRLPPTPRRVTRGAPDS
ncbi:hypothetical protein GUJ93_ZPchr0006g42036 [Zizania palustris]|uniref:Uncharacterized protein n=1 Tax=Zizania palustris TaxID=103762 RepID=A0A8J5SHW1_ZIZPA|nr:hypothetical protein GUJ93_ZPchr0006g42036 [Zizania palustris]